MVTHAEMTVSRFLSLRDTRPEPSTWEDIFREITDGTHAAATLHYRNHLAALPAIEATGDPRLLEQWKDTKSHLKSSYPAFIPSVILKGGRTAAHIKGYTGFVMVDMDGIATDRFADALARVKADAHAFLVYVTVSGQGIRVVSRAKGIADKASFAGAWKQVNDYYSRLCRVQTDGQCKNATRMSVICHDPEALFRPNAAPFTVNAVTPDGRPRRTTAAARAYRVIERQLAEEGIAYAPGSYNDYVSRCLYHMNRYGVAQADAEAFALHTFADYPHAQLLPIVRSCYALTEEFGTIPLPRAPRKKDDNEEPRRKKATVEEMEEYIGRHIDIRMNTLTHQIEIRQAGRWERLTDHAENSLWCAMQRTGMMVNINELHTLLTSDYVKEYHPLKDYLERLPPWDGKRDYIAELAALVHVRKVPAQAESPFTELFRRWMVALIAGALDETVVNQVILTLIGRQGSYKTSFMQHILPPELSGYYTTKSNSQRMTKDDLFTMTENLIINLEEIDTMPPAELNQLKAMVTQRYVNERPAYGRNKVHLPHVASFVATGNNLQFLTDDTGNRRWLPFEVDSIDSPWEADIPYEGIYAQAYALYHDVNFRYWFTDEEIQQLRGYISRFEVPRPENELILTYYRKPRKLERAKYVTTSQVVARLGSASLKLSLTKMGRAMRELGFEKIHTENGNFWTVAERTADEVAHVIPGSENHIPDDDSDPF